jgi:hypothetical protein
MLHPTKGEIEMANLPKLSSRAKQALEVLSNGGEVVHRLERNGYTGREQFATRFMIAGSIIKGLGVATRYELEKAGFQFITTHRTSVSTYYKLNHA